MKTVKKYICNDCKDPETGKIPTWDIVEKTISYDIYGTLRMMEEYANQSPLKECICTEPPELTNNDIIIIKCGTCGGIVEADQP